MKLEDIKNDEGRFFVETWLKALHGLLGWTDEQTLKWAEKWQNDLNDPDCLFFHEPPLYYIIKLLIPKRIEEKFDHERPLLRRVLLGVLEGTPSFNYYTNPNFDWSLAKQRIETFLKEAERQEGPEDAFLFEYEKQVLGYIY